MSLRPLRVLICAVALILALPTVASAQIYAWRDASGNWVLSDKPKDPSAQLQTYGVSKAVTFRTTKAVTGERPSDRLTRYDDLIEENSRVHGVNPHLVRAVIQQESGFNQYALSPKGAMGLMQLMPTTATELGVTDPYNPAQNIRAGVAYLKGLLAKFAQNIELALAAYNAGPTAVAKYGAVPPYRETQTYVTRIKSVVDAQPKPVRIYKTLEIVNGKPVMKYSTVETYGAEVVATSTARPTSPTAAAAPQK
jgi:soluble lytic murein transglycosylase-like protein